MLPNSRIARLTGLDRYSMTLRPKLAGASDLHHHAVRVERRGEQPCRSRQKPFAAIREPSISNSTASAMAEVMLRSVVGTARKYS